MPWTRNQYLKYKFGITLDQYNQILKAQRNLCLGCYRHVNELKRGLFVDHCHVTGKVRGLLCVGCNAAIGMVIESPDVLRRLADYLENTNSDESIYHFYIKQPKLATRFAIKV